MRGTVEMPGEISEVWIDIMMGAKREFRDEEVPGNSESSKEYRERLTYFLLRAIAAIW